MKLDLYGKTINYQISGTGNPFLFVHGWGGNLYSLQILAQLFSTKYMTITIDLPGFGLSDKPDPEWGVGEYAKFLIDFINKLNLKSVIFFGHSFGGALGIFIAANYPNYIKKSFTKYFFLIQTFTEFQNLKQILGKSSDKTLHQTYNRSNLQL